MEIKDFIYEFLVNHDNVEIQGFGIFSSEIIEAYIHPIDNKFSPTNKKISFQLDKNTVDNGFINYLSTKFGYSEELTKSELKTQIASWISSLKSGNILNYKYLGELKLNSSKILIFTAYTDFSLSKNHFGLQSFKVNALPLKKKVDKALNTAENVDIKKRKIWPWIAAIFLLLLVSAGILILKDNIKNSSLFTINKSIEITDSQNTIARTNQNANISKSNNIDSTDTNNQNYESSKSGDSSSINSIISKTENPSDIKKLGNINANQSTKYLVIAGCFLSETKAQTYLNLLISKGYKAIIAGKTSKGLIRVCYGSYGNFEMASQISEQINSKEKTSSWVQKIN